MIFSPFFAKSKTKTWLGQKVPFLTQNSILRCRSQMIAKEDFDFISRFDGANASTRAGLIQQDPLQLPKTFMNLLSQISKDLTIQYLLTLLDDLLQEDKSRVELFKNYAAKKNESVWTQLLTLLNRPVGFIMNMTSRVIAKMACWSRELMTGSDLIFYLNKSGKITNSRN